jgi:hypothetical protein
MGLMTWWAAVLGFVGALAGSWGGQLIASRREDRRWQRERERDDLRHEREIERLRLQHAREVDLAWRSERHTAYTRLLNVLLAFESKVHAPIENPAVVHDPAERAEVRRLHHELHNTYTLVLVGSGSEGLMRAFSTAFDELTEACRNELNLGPQAPPP